MSDESLVEASTWQADAYCCSKPDPLIEKDRVVQGPMRGVTGCYTGGLSGEHSRRNGSKPRLSLYLEHEQLSHVLRQLRDWQFRSTPYANHEVPGRECSLTTWAATKWVGGCSRLHQIRRLGRSE
jgi:hypothetical protein